MTSYVVPKPTEQLGLSNEEIAKINEYFNSLRKIPLTGNEFRNKERLTSVKREYPSAVLIVESNYAINATNTIYTVPTGYKLWLTNAYLSISFNSGTLNNAGSLKYGGDYLLRVSGNDWIAGTADISSNYELLEFPSGSVFEVVSGTTNLRANGGLSGWLLANTD